MIQEVRQRCRWSSRGGDGRSRDDGELLDGVLGEVADGEEGMWSDLAFCRSEGAEDELGERRFTLTVLRESSARGLGGEGERRTAPTNAHRPPCSTVNVTSSKSGCFAPGNLNDTLSK